MADIETEGRAGSPEQPLIEFSFRIPWFSSSAARESPREAEMTEAAAGVWLWALLAAGLVLRLVLAPLPGFSYDIGSFQAWSIRLADIGPWDFYAPDYFSDYAPGYLYVLWLIGKLNQLFHFSQDTYEYVLKLPSILADVGSAYLLYRFLEGQRPQLRLLAATIYLLFPAALLIGAVWGQVDSLGTFALMLSIYLISRRKLEAGTIAYVVSFMIKPQVIAALPFLAFWIMKQNLPRWRETRTRGVRLPVPPALWWRLAGAGFAVLLLMTLPFFPSWKPWESAVDLVDHLQNSANVYKYNSLNAYNLWGTSGFFKPDDGRFIGISQPVWGVILFFVAVALVLYTLRDRTEDWALALGSALCLLAFYVFLTRMHERYLFPVFLPLLAACILARNPLLWAGFTVLGVLHFFNLYYVYSYYPFALPAAGELPREPFMKPLYDWLADARFFAGGSTNQVLSAVVVLLVPVLVGAATLLGSRRAQAEAG